MVEKGKTMKENKFYFCGLCVFVEIWECIKLTGKLHFGFSSAAPADEGN